MYPHPGCCKSVYNVTKNSTPCSKDSSFASVGPYYVVNVSKQMNLCYQVLNEVFIKGAGLLNKMIEMIEMFTMSDKTQFWLGGKPHSFFFDIS